MTSDFHLAQLNIGRLNAPVGDPRVAEFIDNIDRVNELGKRAPGFVWMMEGSGCPREGAEGSPAPGGPGNTDAKIDGDPQFISNLTVWADLASLEAFVWKTIHKRFYDRRDLWFEAKDTPHFVLWRVTAGHRPTLDEGLERLAHLRAHGDTDHAFGWDYARTTLAPATKPETGPGPRGAADHA